MCCVCCIFRYCRSGVQLQQLEAMYKQLNGVDLRTDITTHFTDSFISSVLIAIMVRACVFPCFLRITVLCVFANLDVVVSVYNVNNTTLQYLTLCTYVRMVV